MCLSLFGLIGSKKSHNANAKISTPSTTSSVDHDQKPPRPTGMRPAGRTAGWKHNPAKDSSKRHHPASGPLAPAGTYSPPAAQAGGPYSVATAGVYGNMYSNVADPVYGAVYGPGGGQAYAGADASAFSTSYGSVPTGGFGGLG